MDKEAVSNRCLWDVTEMPAGSHWDLGQATEVRDPYEGSVEGYQLVGPHLRSMDLIPPSGADFKSYATGWEERYSALIRNRGKSLTLFPVVSPTSFFSYKLPPPSRVTMSMFPVIGHYGTVEVRNIIVPNKFETTARGPDRRKALERLLDQNIKAYVEQGYPVFGNWQPFALPHNIGPNFFTVLTDPEGRILASLGASGSEPGLESEDPFSFYLFVVADLMALATKGSRLLLTAARKAAPKVAAKLGAMAGPMAAAKTAFWRAGEIAPRAFTAAETKALTAKIAGRMKKLGIPANNIGIRGIPGESGEAFTALGKTRGSNIRGVGISVHGSVERDWAGFPEWNAATVDTRVDAIIAHEWMEFNQLTHWETVEVVTESKLAITEEAKKLLRAMQKQGHGLDALVDKPPPR